VRPARITFGDCGWDGHDFHHQRSRRYAQALHAPPICPNSHFLWWEYRPSVALVRKDDPEKADEGQDAFAVAQTALGDREIPAVTWSLRDRVDMAAQTTSRVAVVPGIFSSISAAAMGTCQTYARRRIPPAQKEARAGFEPAPLVVAPNVHEIAVEQTAPRFPVLFVASSTPQKGQYQEAGIQETSAPRFPALFVASSTRQKGQCQEASIQETGIAIRADGEVAWYAGSPLRIGRQDSTGQRIVRRRHGKRRGANG
jgi:hypothetical protein